VRQEDLDGADYHAFTGDDAYVWNNKQATRRCCSKRRTS
jgi:hypothetical protein